MTAALKHLIGAVIVLSSRRAAVQEEIADDQRAKSAAPEVLQKRLSDLDALIQERTEQRDKLLGEGGAPKPVVGPVSRPGARKT